MDMDDNNDGLPLLPMCLESPSSKGKKPTPTGDAKKKNARRNTIVLKILTGGKSWVRRYPVPPITRLHVHATGERA
jgi:hypothetical protein